MTIQENYVDIMNKIENACKKSGRNIEDIVVIGVTKTIEIPRIKELIDLGIVNLGENKVQEFSEKYAEIDENINWHMIGHLQKNKIKYIMNKVRLIHSVDSFALANEISKVCSKIGITQNILLEINIASEPTKFGILPENFFETLEKIAFLPNINIRGIMTVAPFVETGEDNRKYFDLMRMILVDSNAKNVNNIHMDILSMGMSSDFEVAIEEGATHVRIGQGFFGNRVYV